MKNLISSRSLTLFSIFVLFFASISCSTDNDPQPTEDYKAFLDKDVVSFSGVVDGNALAWELDKNQFQLQNGIGPTTDEEGEPQKFVEFSLHSQQNGRGVYISTFGFTEESDDLITKVLSVGEKQLGRDYELGNDIFTLSVTINGKEYYSDVPQTNNHLEVLQMVKSKNEANEDIVKVWFVANAMLFNRDDNSFIELKNGKIMASFRF